MVPLQLARLTLAEQFDKVLAVLVEVIHVVLLTNRLQNVLKHHGHLRCHDAARLSTTLVLHDMNTTCRDEVDSSLFPKGLRRDGYMFVHCTNGSNLCERCYQLVSKRYFNKKRTNAAKVAPCRAHHTGNAKHHGVAEAQTMVQRLGYAGVFVQEKRHKSEGARARRRGGSYRKGTDIRYDLVLFNDSGVMRALEVDGDSHLYDERSIQYDAKKRRVVDFRVEHLKLLRNQPKKDWYDKLRAVVNDLQA